MAAYYEIARPLYMVSREDAAYMLGMYGTPEWHQWCSSPRNQNPGGPVSKTDRSTRLTESTTAPNAMAVKVHRRAKSLPEPLGPNICSKHRTHLSSFA
mmetsp:Transcript_16405/g.33554  ORF Transcript_16405/g.33554 Transcript_16405/m.33554 type:complete len:98 (+) Transcript_16405:303-596(+)